MSSENSKKRWRCAVCKTEVPYGQHCPKIPDGDAQKDEAHKLFIEQHKFIYEELKNE